MVRLEKVSADGVLKHLATIGWLTLAGVTPTPAPCARFEVVISPALRREPVTGRLFIFLARDSAPEPRLQGGGVVSAPFFGADVAQLRTGAVAVVDHGALGYPIRSLDALPPGDYYVQALLSEYTKFARADGHTIWAHMDQWEGQQVNTAPGTLVSG